MAEPWPCWTCKFRGALDTTGFYSCERPLSSQIAIWEHWNLAPRLHSARMIGSEMEVRGETPADRPECPVYEANA